MRARLFALGLCLSASAFAQTNLVEQARAALQRNDAQAAADLLEKAIAQNPNNAEAHYLLSDAYGTLAQNASIFSKPGLAKKAQAELQRAIDIDPNYTAARFGMIEYDLSAPSFLGGGEDKAIAQASEIKKRDAIDGHRALAMIYQREKKPELARQEYVDAVKEQPNSARAHYWLGVYDIFEKKYADAGTEFETALKLDPHYMPAWFQIGHVAAAGGTNLPNGEDALKKYLAYTPTTQEPPLYRAHYWLGAIYEKQGRKSEAKASYAMSLRINPNQRDVAEAMKRLQ